MMERTSDRLMEVVFMPNGTVDRLLEVRFIMKQSSRRLLEVPATKNCTLVRKYGGVFGT
jgi:hypothetical protein